MNWTYYDQIYGSGEFQGLWGLTSYLNQKGITNGVMYNFQGFGPAWMLESNGATLAPGEEDEWAEMIASLLIYARTNLQLQFTVVGPDNEEDWNGAAADAQGILMTGAAQYVTALHYLAVKLATNGISNLDFVVPDMVFTDTNWWETVMSDPVVMAQVAHFGVHTYGNMNDLNDGGYSDGMASFLQNSPYPNSDFWVTEFNVGCSTCTDGSTNNGNGWSYYLGTAQYLLAQLANGATACLVWEGYDGYYLSSSNPDYYYYSTWGIFQWNNSGESPASYTPRGRCRRLPGQISGSLQSWASTPRPARNL
jgi:hypothetical protein